MAKSVIALYEDFGTARQVVEELVSAGFSRDNISIISPDTTGEYSSYMQSTGMHHDDDDVSAGEGAGFGAVVGALVGLGVALIPGIGPVLAAGPFAAAAMAGIGAVAGAATGSVVAGLVDMGVPEDEAHHYAEGIRRGGTMVSITVEDSSVNRAQEIMNRYGALDLDSRAASWREEGWTGFTADAQPYTGTTGSSTMSSTTARPAEEARFDVVEENLRVGKRDVESGGVRVRSYVTATPVEEQVRLREEHVRVDRHPVNRPATEADIATFQEGVIEVTEHHEEAVVAKEARVVEEVVVGKEVAEHVETIRDTVRRTDVEVEQLSGNTTYGAYETYEPRFRNLWASRYSSRGGAYENYMPAYRYGHSLAGNSQYRDYDWSRLEPEARRQWESRYSDSPWEQFKDAVHDAWMEVTGRR